MVLVRVVNYRIERLIALGVALATFASAAPAAADNIDITPTTVTLGAGRISAAIEVANRNPKAVLFQTQALAWRQTGGANAFDATTDVRISPPIFTAAPGTTQIVRIGLRDAAVSVSERAYRLLIKEVPTAVASGVAMPLQFNLPVFFVPASGAATLAWSIRALDGRRAELTIVNSGTMHEHFTALRLDDGAARPLAEQDVNLYVLAGAQVALTLPLAHALGDGPIHVEAKRGTSKTLLATVGR